MSFSSRRFSTLARSVVLGLLAAGLVASGAAAQSGGGGGGKAAFEITVLVVSQDPAKKDGRAGRFDRILRKRLRYESLRFVKSQRREVAIDGIGSVAVPGARAFRFRPLDAKGGSVLVAVDWETRGDFRIRRGRPLILGGPPGPGGEIVVVLEAR